VITPYKPVSKGIKVVIESNRHTVKIDINLFLILSKLKRQSKPSSNVKPILREKLVLLEKKSIYGTCDIKENRSIVNMCLYLFFVYI
jgi:hypothetical protein